MTVIGKDAPFDPARESDLYALTESGWINIRGDNGEWRPKFLFGGSFALPTRFHALGQTTRALEIMNETMTEHGLGQSQSAVNVALMGRAALTLAREGAPHDTTEGK